MVDRSRSLLHDDQCGFMIDGASASLDLIDGLRRGVMFFTALATVLVILGWS